jgi:hypothetical protein
VYRVEIAITKLNHVYWWATLIYLHSKHSRRDIGPAPEPASEAIGGQGVSLVMGISMMARLSISHLKMS